MANSEFAGELERLAPLLTSPRTGARDKKVVALIVALALASVAAQPLSAPLAPYAGPTTRLADAVDASTLTGKVMCGYQGWFDADHDGAARGWVHWTHHGDRAPGEGNVSVELWPDVSELAPSERYATDFHHADGSVAEVFSSHNRDTVVRHFQWMRTYGIDGVFVQRFASDLRDTLARRHDNAVLGYCREGANLNGRTYATMYDLSGLQANEIELIENDWRSLRSDAQITQDPAYLHHNGKPVVAVWGIGFNDNRPYTLAECGKLIDFLKADGCTVMIGVPTYWREQNRDTVTDATLHEVMKKADIISPWTVGRYDSPTVATKYARETLTPDVAWCKQNKLDYLPVVFPGFSWTNLKGGDARFDQIPRLGGHFLWQQFVNVHAAGATMVYVAMFDEVDEGTAIFKCTNDVPVGKQNRFLTLGGLPSDFYLKLVGEGTRLMRNERPTTFPVVK